MRNIFLIITLLFSISTFAQQGRYKPFSMAIISVDTAVIDPSLTRYIDTIEKAHFHAYNDHLAELRMIANDTAKIPESLISPEEVRNAKSGAQAELKQLYSVKDKIKKFKYYQAVSEYSSAVYAYYFNEYPPLSTITVTAKTGSSLQDLTRVADSLKSDYVLAFRNIHTVNTAGLITLRLTTILYSAADHKIILEKETEGENKSLGSMWTCDNPLMCLLITGIKSSSEAVTDILLPRQLK